jgi:hypothetical protein
MLPASIVEALDIDLQRVMSRSAFFADYAELTEAEERPTALDLIRLAENSALDELGGQVVGLGDLADAERGSSELLSQIERLGIRETVPEWVRVAEAADAWRESALADLLIDIDRARMKLNRASISYVRLGMPFGWYLATVSTGSPEAAWSAGRWLDTLSAGVPSYEQRQEPEGILDVRRALRVPAQQLYLLLAAASDAQVISEHGRSIEQLAGAPQARGLAPVGSTAQPLGEWWSAGLALARLHHEDTQARARLVHAIAEFGAAHGRQLERAKRDSYHWRLVSAPVDLVDLDMAGLVCLADRALRDSGGAPLELSELEPLSELSKVSLVIGLQLSRGEQEPPPVLEPQPTEPTLPTGGRPRPRRPVRIRP